MTLKSTVETITHTAVSTAVTAVRDPFGTAAKATGLVKETAGVGIGLVRDRIAGAVEQAPEPVKEVAEEVVTKIEDVVPDEVVDKVEEAVTEVDEAAPTEKKASAEKSAATDDPRDHIPGPDLAAFAPPAPEDLPEPIVIEAE